MRFAERGARTEPGSSQYALLAGKLNDRYHDADAAAPWYAEAQARDPNNPDVLGEVAAFEAARDPKHARALVDRALRLAPMSNVAWYGLGVVEEAAGDSKQARVAYEKAVSLAPDYALANAALARMKGESGD